MLADNSKFPTGIRFTIGWLDHNLVKLQSLHICFTLIIEPMVSMIDSFASPQHNGHSWNNFKRQLSKIMYFFSIRHILRSDITITRVQWHFFCNCSLFVSQIPLSPLSNTSVALWTSFPHCRSAATTLSLRKHIWSLTQLYSVSFMMLAWQLAPARNTYAVFCLSVVSETTQEE